MATKDARRKTSRTRTIETLESRQYMAADTSLLARLLEQHAIADEPIELHGSLAGRDFGLEQHFNRDADFWIATESERDLVNLAGDIQQTLASAHSSSGLTQVRNDYGFIGTGQTVAIIDSGIAYDHSALGGGFGANYRVVGGWDFTENDANPYDDGPGGSHGTHVAGIVGSDRSGTFDDGVAPGVDLVGLRVFNDAGEGYFSWVENALRWVHQNRNSFENPITAINLSLGTSWNATTVPSWSTLEDEFAQLKADGIFIAVSAGNSFANYNTPGLSYPAASQYVVPVMATTDAGTLASFSQRHTSAIAAPGQYIVSTVPDYAGNHNGITDDYASFSGTSMAAPYVAGASVLVREAMQFLGYMNITQDTIFNHLMNTATSFFDSATNQTYKRINLANAFDALMPTDDYGSTSSTAHNLGTLSTSREFSGLIGKLSDQDYFTFTASATGTVNLAVSADQDLEPSVTVTGATASGQNGSWSFNVVAGQSYTISLKTAAGHGIGYYDADLSLAPASLPTMTVKTVVTTNGTYTLDSDGWVSINNTKVWSNTRDFAAADNGTVHWLGLDGTLARRTQSGGWQTLDTDARKFSVTVSGVTYSIGADAWVNMNGTRVWSDSVDFATLPDGSIYWQNSGGTLYQRTSSGVWNRIDSGIERFVVAPDNTAYSLRSNDLVTINGYSVWSNTNDFVFASDQSVYWHNNDGKLYNKPNGGSWRLVADNVAQFAVRQDCAAYVLGTDGSVRVNGTVTWSNISQLSTDWCGRLVLQTTTNSTQRVNGCFAAGSKLSLQSNQQNSQQSIAYSTRQVNSAVLATDVFFAKGSVVQINSGQASLESVGESSLTRSLGNEHTNADLNCALHAFESDLANRDDLLEAELKAIVAGSDSDHSLESLDHAFDVLETQLAMLIGEV